MTQSLLPKTLVQKVYCWTIKCCDPSLWHCSWVCQKVNKQTNSARWLQLWGMENSITAAILRRLAHVTVQTTPCNRSEKTQHSALCHRKHKTQQGLASMETRRGTSTVTWALVTRALVTLTEQRGFASRRGSNDSTEGWIVSITESIQHRYFVSWKTMTASNGFVFYHR